MQFQVYMPQVQILRYNNRSVYTITLGGSACAHSVNSGRHAAMNAKKYIDSL